MNWLITGGCGFIGINLINKILKISQENNIRVVDNLSVGSREKLSQVTKFAEICNTDEIGNSFEYRVELIVGDIKNPNLALNVTKNIDVIIHLAGNTGVFPSVINPRNDFDNNALGVFNYLEAARVNKVEKFVFASSGAPAGEVIPPIDESVLPKPISPYGASKLLGEGYCSAYYGSFQIDTVCLRFSNVYGPRSGHKSSVVAQFLSQSLNGKKIQIYGTGKQTRDFIFIDDLVEAIIRSVERSNIGGEVFQIASGIETSLNDLAEYLKEALINNHLAFPGIEYKQKRKGDVMRNFARIDKAKSMLDWLPKTDLSQGLDITVKYFLNEKFAK